MEAQDGGKNIQLKDKRIKKWTTLDPPKVIWKEIPVSEESERTVEISRTGIEQILDRADSRSRIIIVTGPCSIHSYEAAIEYARLLKPLSDKVSDKFLIVMRAYFEKPRTGPGAWEGLIVDPDMNRTFNVNKGYRISRRILADITSIGIPCATEYLESFTPHYTAELVSWAAIGARTVTATHNRRFSTGLSMPVGVKNDLYGEVEDAVLGVKYVMYEGIFHGIDENGRPSAVETLGNPYAHIVLRGGKGGVVNYNEECVKAAQRMLEDSGLPPVLMVDCSHGNSEKDYRKQPQVFENVIQQIRDGNSDIIGLALESHILGGKQDLPKNLKGFDKSTLDSRLSATDSCLPFDDTQRIILDAHKSLTGASIYLGGK